MRQYRIERIHALQAKELRLRKRLINSGDTRKRKRLHRLQREIHKLMNAEMGAAFTTAASAMRAFGEHCRVAAAAIQMAITTGANIRFIPDRTDNGN